MRRKLVGSLRVRGRRWLHQVAPAAGVMPSAIVRLLLERLARPVSFLNLMKIADVLEVELSQILKSAGY